jgi:large subunit ribosomal protein L32
MAALALTHNPNTLLSLLHRGIRSLFQAPSSLLDLLPPIILAVPKSKVSHSRKSMRSANKGLKEKFSE